MDLSSLMNIAKNIQGELALAAENTPSSFPYIRNPLPAKQNSPEKIQVLVIGGSVFKKGIFKREDNGYQLLLSEKRLQPVFHTKKDFLDFCLSEIDTSIVHIGVNFAYPLMPRQREGRLDGILLQGMKENRFAGLVKEMVGKELEKNVLAKTGKSVKISLANDTVCLLLSGMEKAARTSLMAGIIGTGINLAFFENEHTAVNLEAANFDKFDPSPAMRELDQHSAFPGKALFEKEIAGGYLFEHYNHQIKTLGLSSRLLYSTRELDIIASSPGKESKIAKDVLARSAHLTGALLAGAVNFLQKDLVCVMEGSLFWKGYRYQETVEQTIRLLQPNHNVRLIHIANSALFGGAYLFG